MKTYYATTLTFFLTITTFVLASPPDSTANIWDKAGSGISISEGKNLFSQGNTRGALIKFREALAKYENSPNANYWIAECQYRLNSYGVALKYCNRAIELNPKINKEVYVLRGKSYHRMNKLDSALLAYNKAKEINNKSNNEYYRVEYLIKSVGFAKEATKNSKEINSKALPEPVNSKFHDYSPVLADGGKTLYFTSRRNNTTGGTVNPGDNVFFEDIYKATWSESKKTWVTASNKIDKVNSAGHESVSDISSDGLKMLLTINDDAENLTKKEKSYKSKSSDVCVAMKTDQGGWNKPRLLSKKTQSGAYDGGATMTKDGFTIYYSSQDKEKEGMNLFEVTSADGKRWSEPKKLPSHINTKYHETTPVISPDGQYLFFSSNGHIGMGGYDVFVTKRLGEGEWSLPVNLGSPINTVNNDTHFRYYKDLKKAYMAKMVLVGNKASTDILEVDMSNFEFPKFEGPKEDEEKK